MTKRILVVYAALVLAGFVLGYAVLEIRELGLYYFLLILNLPASLLTVPLFESAALSLGIRLGSAEHAFAIVLFSLVLNMALLSIGIGGWRRWRRAV